MGKRKVIKLTTEQCALHMLNANKVFTAALLATETGMELKAANSAYSGVIIGCKYKTEVSAVGSKRTLKVISIDGHEKVNPSEKSELWKKALFA